MPVLLGRNLPAAGLEFQVEIFTQIDAADLGVCAEGFGRAGAEDFSVVNDVSAVGDGESFADVVICDQDADAGVFEIEDDALKLEDLNGIDTDRKSVVEGKSVD